MKEYLFSFFGQYHPVTQALIATLFTWFVTAAGAAPVFFAKRVDQILPPFTFDGLRDCRF